MQPSPPVLPAPRPPSVRTATLLNVAVPGVGLFLLGRRKLGLVIAALFLACFFAVMALFLLYYARYIALATSDDLLKGDRLERHGELFPTKWLIGLAVAGGIIHLISMMLLRRAKKRLSPVVPTAKA